MKIIYPIEYRQIPTQYAFLISKEQGKYRVQVQAVRDLKEEVFDSEEEAREFIKVRIIK